MTASQRVNSAENDSSFFLRLILQGGNIPSKDMIEFYIADNGKLPQSWLTRIEELRKLVVEKVNDEEMRNEIADKMDCDSTPTKSDSYIDKESKHGSMLPQQSISILGSKKRINGKLTPVTVPVIVTPTKPISTERTRKASSIIQKKLKLGKLPSQRDIDDYVTQRGIPLPAKTQARIDKLMAIPKVLRPTQNRNPNARSMQRSWLRINHNLCKKIAVTDQDIWDCWLDHHDVPRRIRERLEDLKDRRRRGVWHSKV